MTIAALREELSDERVTALEEADAEAKDVMQSALEKAALEAEEEREAALEEAKEKAQAAMEAALERLPPRPATERASALSQAAAEAAEAMGALRAADKHSPILRRPWKSGWRPTRRISVLLRRHLRPA